MWVIKLYHFNCNWKKKEGRADKEGERKGWKWKRRKGEGREEEGREGEDNSPVSSKLKCCSSSYDFCWTVEICTLYVLFFMAHHVAYCCDSVHILCNGDTWAIHLRSTVAAEPARWSAFRQHTLQRDCISGVHYGRRSHDYFAKSV